MKNKLQCIIFIIFLFFKLSAQQAMALKPGVIDLKAKTASSTEAFCVQYHEAIPQFGDIYTNIANGSIFVKKGSEEIPISRAISEGIISISGDNSPSSLRFVNHTSDPVSIEIRESSILSTRRNDYFENNEVDRILKILDSEENDAETDVQHAIWNINFEVRQLSDPGYKERIKRKETEQKKIMFRIMNFSKQEEKITLGESNEAPSDVVGFVQTLYSLLNVQEKTELYGFINAIWKSRGIDPERYNYDTNVDLPLPSVIVKEGQNAEIEITGLTVSIKKDFLNDFIYSFEYAKQHDEIRKIQQELNSLTRDPERPYSKYEDLGEKESEAIDEINAVINMYNTGEGTDQIYWDLFSKDYTFEEFLENIDDIISVYYQNKKKEINEYQSKLKRYNELIKKLADIYLILKNPIRFEKSTDKKEIQDAILLLLAKDNIQNNGEKYFKDNNHNLVLESTGNNNLKVYFSRGTTTEFSTILDTPTYIKITGNSNDVVENLYTDLEEILINKYNPEKLDSLNPDTKLDETVQLLENIDFQQLDEPVLIPIRNSKIYLAIDRTTNVESIKKLKKPLRKSDWLLLPFVEDKKTIEFIQTHSSETYTFLENLTPDSLENFIAGHKGKYLILFAHFENDFFHFKGKSITYEKIAEIAHNYGVDIMLAGCNTSEGKARSGTKGFMNSYRFSEVLYRAYENESINSIFSLLDTVFKEMYDENKTTFVINATNTDSIENAKEFNKWSKNFCLKQSPDSFNQSFYIINLINISGSGGAPPPKLIYLIIPIEDEENNEDEKNQKAKKAEIKSYGVINDQYTN